MKFLIPVFFSLLTSWAFAQEVMKPVSYFKDQENGFTEISPLSTGYDWAVELSCSSIFKKTYEDITFYCLVSGDKVIGFRFEAKAPLGRNRDEWSNNFEAIVKEIYQPDVFSVSKTSGTTNGRGYLKITVLHKENDQTAKLDRMREMEETLRPLLIP